MRRFVYAVLVLLAWHPGLALADGEVGVITEVSGEAELLRGDQALAAEAGVNLMPGDVVRTGDDATVQIDMDDGSSFAMGAKSSLRIHEYRMHKDHSIIAAAIDKISGWLHFAVAKLRHADYYRFQMPTAVLGVRGTEGVLNVEGEGSSAQSNIMLDKGNVEVAERVANGRLAGNRLRLTSGEYAYRRFGRMLSMRRNFPEQLRRRMPAFVRARLVRRVRFLKRRGIRPRRIEGRLFRLHRRERQRMAPGRFRQGERRQMMQQRGMQQRGMQERRMQERRMRERRMRERRMQERRMQERRMQERRMRRRNGMGN